MISKYKKGLIKAFIKGFNSADEYSKLKCVKEVKEEFKIGLKDAKQFCDEYYNAKRRV